jgi:hypothetical protein
MGHDTRPVPPQVVEEDWVKFPGGELEGQRPKTLCPACRAALGRGGAAGSALRQRRTLCFQCYRADLERTRALRAAGRLDTGSEARFQYVLPLEAVDKPRLERLKADRVAVLPTAPSNIAGAIDRRRRAQMAARRALQSIVAVTATLTDRQRAIADAVHAAELQLPESWLPFVVGLQS